MWNFLSHLQQFPEVWAARRQHDAMCFQAATIAGECDVDEVLVIAQILERRGDAALVVVPSETKVLGVGHFASLSGNGPWIRLTSRWDRYGSSVRCR